jgi:hypothetical protein
MPQLGKRRGVALNKRAYPHLAFQLTRHGKEAILYRYKGRIVRIWSDPETEPEKFKADYDAAVAGGDLPRPPGKVRLTAKAGSWTAAIDDFRRDKDYQKRPNTQRQYDMWLNGLHGAIGDQMMRSTEKRRVYAMHNDLVTQGRQVYANQLLTVLRGLVKQARINGWLRDDGLLFGLEFQKITDVNHFRPYRQEEIDQWRDAYSFDSAAELDVTARAAFELTYHCALGNAELIRFAPCHIEPNGDYAIKRQKLNAKDGGWQRGNIYSDPMLARAIDVLQARPTKGEDVIDIKTGRSTTPLLRNQHGNAFSGSTMRKQWQRWREAIGLPDDFNIHSGRTSLVTDMMDEGVLATDGMAKTGHMNIDTYLKSYGHARDTNRAAARADTQVGAARRKRVGAAPAKAAANAA